MKDQPNEQFQSAYYSQDTEARLAQSWRIEEVLVCWKMLRQVEEVESFGEHCLSESWDKNE